MASSPGFSTTSLTLTSHKPTGGDNPREEIISYEDALTIVRMFVYVVIPIVSILGVVGNIFSIIILVKHGLGKCSNILLFCLAITDLSYLVAFNNPPRIIYETVGSEKGFAYSESASYALFVFYTLFNILDYGMSYAAFLFPVLITGERLVAVFIPLMFHKIITPFRTWCAIAGVYLFSYSYVLYSTFWFELVYVPGTNTTAAIGLVKPSALYFKDFHNVALLQEAFIYMGWKIPPCFTIIGCIAISFKIRMARLQRKKLTSIKNKDTASSNRTTRMLLAVCAMYTVTCVVSNLPSFIPQYFYHPIAGGPPSNISIIMYQVANLIFAINSSWNFIVYVGMNKNFRDTFKSLFIRCYT